MKAHTAIMALILFLGMVGMAFAAVPTLNEIPDQVVSENLTLSLTASAAYSGSDTLIYSAVSKPSGSTFDPATRIFSWQPTFTQSGKYEVVLKVAEQSNASSFDTESFNITVVNVNRAPTISVGSVTIDSDEDSATKAITASDPDGDTLTYTIAAQSANTTIATCYIDTPTTGTLRVARGSDLMGETSKTTQCTIQVTDGSFTAQAVYTVTVEPMSMLDIEKVSVIVADDSNRLDKGDDFEVEIGDSLEFEVKVANLYTDDEDIEIRDVSGTIEIDDWDDGDSEEWDSTEEYDINADDSETLAFDLGSVPDALTDGDHTVTLTVEGRDAETSAKYKLTWTFTLTIDKESEDIRVTTATIEPTTVSCTRKALLSVKLVNAGTKDSDEIAFTIKNSELGIKIEDTGIELDEGDSETLEYEITVPSTAAAKTYTLALATYFDDDAFDDNDQSDVATAKLTVQSCQPEVPPVCNPSWSCGEWSDCVSGSQMRVCSDKNSCGVATGKPVESQTCTVPGTEEEEEQTGTTWGIPNYVLIGGLIFLNLLLLIGIIVLFAKLLRD